MSDDATVKLADVVGAAEVAPLAPGDAPLGGLVLLKILSNNGKMGWVLRHFGDLSQVELIGGLLVTLDREEAEFLDGWEPDGEDDDA